MHRGARRAAIFLRDAHYFLFLRSLQETVQHFGLEVHGYSLMPNHFHLLVRSPLGNLSRCMRHLDATYTQRLNRRQGWDGALFRGRFHSQAISDPRHLEVVFAYVHLNPHRAGLASRLDDFSWTSLRAYLGEEPPPAWLATRWFLERFGGPGNIARRLGALLGADAAWPPELDERNGWLQAPAPAPASPEIDPADTDPDVDAILRRVAAVTGTTVADLRSPVRGRTGNPARRVAVYALSRAKNLSHRQIGQALGMTAPQVTYALWHLRQELRPALRSWLSELGLAEEIPISNDLTPA